MLRDLYLNTAVTKQDWKCLQGRSKLYHKDLPHVQLHLKLGCIRFHKDTSYMVCRISRPTVSEFQAQKLASPGKHGQWCVCSKLFKCAWDCVCGGDCDPGLRFQTSVPSCWLSLVFVAHPLPQDSSVQSATFASLPNLFCSRTSAYPKFLQALEATELTE